MSVRRSFQAVVHPLPISPGLHNPRIAEISQVAGNLGLGGVQNLHKIADADFLLRHQIQ